MGEIGSCHFDESIAFWHVFCESNPLLSHPPLSPRRVSPFLAWGDFHARSRFARSTISEEKWGTTRSLNNAKWKPLPEQYFHVVFFILLYKVVLTFESLDEILNCHSNESYLQHFHVVLFILLCDLVLALSARIKSKRVTNECNTKSLCCLFRVLLSSLSSANKKIKETKHFWSTVYASVYFTFSLTHPLYFHFLKTTYYNNQLF